MSTAEDQPCPVFRVRLERNTIQHPSQLCAVPTPAELFWETGIFCWCPNVTGKVCGIVIQISAEPSSLQAQLKADLTFPHPYSKWFIQQGGPFLTQMMALSATPPSAPSLIFHSFCSPRLHWEEMLSKPCCWKTFFFASVVQSIIY